jgi:hypothetical protein
MIVLINFNLNGLHTIPPSPQEDGYFVKLREYYSIIKRRTIDYRYRGVGMIEGIWNPLNYQI